MINVLRFGWVICWFVLPLLAGAQIKRGSVQGIVFDSSATQTLQGATLKVISRPDSQMVSVGMSGQKGHFTLSDIPFGSYTLEISFAGFETLAHSFSLTNNHPDYQTGALNLQPWANLMEGVVIKTSPLTINGDTTDIRVTDFRTIPNATAEDLLKKLPGVEVEKDGTVKSQGQTVTRILVDGKRFFGKDPKMATQNLPADIIDRIQIIDSKSEQSEFSGFDDGERVQTINIITKKDRKKGVFGKGTVSAGTDERAAAAGSAHWFNNTRQLSVIAQSNNINQQQFTIKDFLGTQPDNGKAKRQGVNDNTAMNANGISTTHAAGFNYSDVWSTRTKVNASYFYDKVTSRLNRDRLRQTFFATDSSLYNTNTTQALNRNLSHRFNLEVDHQFDSSNSLLVRPEFSLQDVNNNNRTVSANTRGKTVPLNTVTNLVETINQGYDFANNVLFRHRFHKAGRSVSINFTQRLNTNDWQRDNVAYTLRPSGKIDTLDQTGTNIRDGKTIGTNLSFTEKLGIRSQVELTYAYNHTSNNADQLTYKLDKLTGLYTIEVANLTNRFQNINTSQRGGFNYRLQLAPELNVSAGMALQYSQLQSNNLTRKTTLSQSFTNLFPTVNVLYRKNRKESLRFTYRGITRQPSVTQLQDVLDNSRVLHIRSGNPALKQEFVNDLVFRYNTLQAGTQRQLSVHVNGSLTRNQIANTLTINNTSDTVLVDGYKLGPGVQFSKFRNVNGAFEMGGSFNYSFPVTKSVGNFLHLGGRLHFDREVNLINQQVSNTDNYQFSASAKLTMNLNDRLDLNMGTQTQYTLARYSVYQMEQGDFLTQRFSVEPTYMTPSGWMLANDFEYILYRGQTNGFNQSVPLWNVSFSKLFLKNKQAEVKVSVFDLLNKNAFVSRQVEQNYVEDSRTEVLKRYFMLGFTYHLKKISAQKKVGKGK